MEHEAPPANTQCFVCHVADIAWKCLDCEGGCACCTSCLRKLHQRSPFHRIKSWDGTCYQPAWLFQAGVQVHLGHNGAACPTTLCEDPETTEDLDLPWPGSAPGEDDPDASNIGSCGRINKSGFPRSKNRAYKLLVDRSGVHPLKVNLCYCSGAEPQDLQYFSAGFFPATFDQVETAFSFRLLDDLRMDNLECKTPVLNFWHRLRRITAPLDPGSVPVRLKISPNLVAYIPIAEPLPRADEGISTMAEPRVAEASGIFVQR